MKPLSKHVRSLLLLLTVGIAPQLAVALPTCSSDCGFTVGVQGLVLMPITCPFDFAADPGAETTLDDSVASVRCPLDWGIRVLGNYEQQCWFAGASYQYFDARVKKGNDNPNLVSRVGTGDATRVKLEVNYQYAEVRLGKYIHQRRGCQFYLFGNTRWVDLWSRRQVSTAAINGVTLSFNEKSELHGGALGIGAGSTSNICGPLNLFGEVNMLGVIGQRSAVDNEFMDASTQRTAAIDVSYSSDVCVVPELNFRLGLNYTYNCRGSVLVGEIGYELDHFWNSFAFNDYAIGQSPTTQFRKCENIGFSGLFFGGKILF